MSVISIRIPIVGIELRNGARIIFGSVRIHYDKFSVRAIFNDVEKCKAISEQIDSMQWNPVTADRPTIHDS